MKSDRREQIAALVSSAHTITNAELMEHFGISIETLRRDLSALERQGVLERVYGGAVQRKAVPQEPGYTNRERQHTEEKLAIARFAETLLAQNDTVYFDNGTSVLYLAHQLTGEKRITAITNTLRIAAVLADQAKADVIMLGGSLRPKELCVSGSDAKEQLARFNIDKAIIGIGGINAEGVTDFHYEEAALRRQVIKNARQIIALADYSKFSIHALHNICAIEDIDILVTDTAAPKEILEQIKGKGVQVFVASANKEERSKKK